MADAVDAILAQWARERPDVDVSAMGVVGRISRAQLLLGRELKGFFAERGLESWEFDVLATLRHGAPYELTAGALLRAAMVTSGAITNRIDRMEAKGLVERVRDAGDRRSVRIRLTPRGLETVDELVGLHAANEERMLAALDPAERERLAGGARCWSRWATPPGLARDVPDGAGDAVGDGGQFRGELGRVEQGVVDGQQRDAVGEEPQRVRPGVQQAGAVAGRFQDAVPGGDLPGGLADGGVQQQPARIVPDPLTRASIVQDTASAPGSSCSGPRAGAVRAGDAVGAEGAPSGAVLVVGDQVPAALPATSRCGCASRRVWPPPAAV